MRNPECIEEGRETFSPGVILPDGDTWYPNGMEWLLFFALKGCKWAADALETPEVKAQILRCRDPIETMWGEM